MAIARPPARGGGESRIKTRRVREITGYDSSIEMISRAFSPARVAPLSSLR